MHFVSWVLLTPTHFPQFAHEYLVANFYITLSSVKKVFVLPSLTINLFFLKKAFFHLNTFPAPPCHNFTRESKKTSLELYPGIIDKLAWKSMFIAFELKAMI